MTLRINALFHVDFEDLGFIEQWANNHGHTISYTRFYNQDSLPEQGNFDWLIIMGGPMSIHDEPEFPWLADEKLFIKQSIDNGKNVIGICLGAQLIAHGLSATVKPSGVKEIGWLPIELTEEAKQHPLLQELPKQAFTVFHWHGDGFDCPQGATAIATSEAWENQGFIYQTPKHKELGSWIIGWQCHFEVTHESMVKMVEHGRNEIEGELNNYPKSVQSPAEIIKHGYKYIDNNNAWLATILDNLANTVTSTSQSQDANRIAT